MSTSGRKAVSEATVVLTNPTHFAVALRYRPGFDTAPVLVAKGRGVTAEAIRELARRKCGADAELSATRPRNLLHDAHQPADP